MQRSIGTLSLYSFSLSLVLLASLFLSSCTIQLRMSRPIKLLWYHGRRWSNFLDRHIGKNQTNYSLHIYHISHVRRTVRLIERYVGRPVTSHLIAIRFYLELIRVTSGLFTRFSWSSGRIRFIRLNRRRQLGRYFIPENRNVTVTIDRQWIFVSGFESKNLFQFKIFLSSAILYSFFFHFRVLWEYKPYWFSRETYDAHGI